MTKTYPTDLTDAERECPVPHVPVPNKRGRSKVHPTGEAFVYAAMVRLMVRRLARP